MIDIHTKIKELLLQHAEEYGVVITDIRINWAYVYPQGKPKPLLTELEVTSRLT